MVSSLPGSSAYRIFETRILDWVALLSSRGSFHPGTEPGSPGLQVDFFFTTEPPVKSSVHTMNEMIGST